MFLFGVFLAAVLCFSGEIRVSAAEPAQGQTLPCWREREGAHEQYWAQVELIKEEDKLVSCCGDFGKDWPRGKLVLLKVFYRRALEKKSGWKLSLLPRALVWVLWEAGWRTPAPTMCSEAFSLTSYLHVVNLLVTFSVLLRAAVWAWQMQLMQYLCIMVYVVPSVLWQAVFAEENFLIFFSP